MRIRVLLAILINLYDCHIILLLITCVRRIFERAGARKFKYNEDQKKIFFSLRFSPVFGPKLGEDQKKSFSLGFSPVLCPNFLPKLQTGGRAMPQFCIICYANYILYWRPKGGAWHHAPSKYAPITDKLNQIRLVNWAMDIWSTLLQKLINGIFHKMSFDSF